ncbi:uncharacterized protein A4U43_C09F10230 [Asparagus officinalis]|uniref:Uncharacterized protein n=1 Tax=Asparagus officinalis TaxID=4686 RepID=A0A5P1E8C1_ASPOF|nr:uncharacterized protein A4U43_C09F10230 [Asparagus officinalis]
METRKLMRSSTTGATDATIIVSSEDEEGEKEDVDHAGGSDADTDGAFRDYEEDGSALPPREPVLEVMTPILVGMTPGAVDQWTHLLTSVRARVTASPRPHGSRQVDSPIKPSVPVEGTVVRAEEAPILGEVLVQGEEAPLLGEASL